MLCPLAIIGGQKMTCTNDCTYCPPQALEKMASYSEYLSCLNFPNDMFGNGAAENGLFSVATAIDGLASAMEVRECQ